MAEEQKYILPPDKGAINRISRISFATIKKFFIVIKDFIVNIFGIIIMPFIFIFNLLRTPFRELSIGLKIGKAALLLIIFAILAYLLVALFIIVLILYAVFLGLSGNSNKEVYIREP